MTGILYEAGAADLSTARAKMAGGNEEALEQLATQYKQSSNGGRVAAALASAKAAFREARATVRNELLHAHPFTAGSDAAGAYLPGLAYTARDGKSGKTVARTPEDLLDLATKIELAIDPLNDAREAVQKLPLPALLP